VRWNDSSCLTINACLLPTKPSRDLFPPGGCTFERFLSGSHLQTGPCGWDVPTPSAFAVGMSLCFPFWDIACYLCWGAFDGVDRLVRSFAPFRCVPSSLPTVMMCSMHQVCCWGNEASLPMVLTMAACLMRAAKDFGTSHSKRPSCKMSLSIPGSSAADNLAS
jgi:hypothetical protein